VVEAYVNHPKTLENELVGRSWTLDLVHQLTPSIVILTLDLQCLSYIHLPENLNKRL